MIVRIGLRTKYVICRMDRRVHWKTGRISTEPGPTSTSDDDVIIMIDFSIAFTDVRVVILNIRRDTHECIMSDSREYVTRFSAGVCG